MEYTVNEESITSACGNHAARSVRKAGSGKPHCRKDGRSFSSGDESRPSSEENGLASEYEGGLPLEPEPFRMRRVNSGQQRRRTGEDEAGQEDPVLDEEKPLEDELVVAEKLDHGDEMARRPNGGPHWDQSPHLSRTLTGENMEVEEVEGKDESHELSVQRVPRIGYIEKNGPCRYGRMNALLKQAKAYDKARNNDAYGEEGPLQGVVLKSMKKKITLSRNGEYEQSKQWDIQRQLGEGRFGSCALLVDRTTEFQFCSKKIDFEDYNQEEIRALAKLSGSNNIVELYGVLSDGKCVYILLKYIQGKTLEKYRSGLAEKCFNLGMVIRFLRLGLSILDDVHGKGWIHNDLKAQNWMMVEDTLVLVDFGCARYKRKSRKFKGGSRPGAPILWSPEKAKKIYNHKADIWALAITAIGMREPPGKEPWHDVRDVDHLEAKLQISENPIKYLTLMGVSEDLYDLLQWMLSDDHELRPTAAEAMKHQLFSNQY